MITINVEQGSPEWFAARLGIPTASNFDKIVTSKGETSKQAEKYMYQLAAERITGYPEEGYEGHAMLRGSALESEAKQLYEMTTGEVIEKVGICYPDEKKLFSCSPDGLIGDHGLLEIKCPQSYAAVGYLLDGGLPSEYVQQVQGQLLVTERQWVDFMVYYPGLKPLIVKVYKDLRFCMLLDANLKDFCKNLDKITERLR